MTQKIFTFIAFVLVIPCNLSIALTDKESATANDEQASTQPADNQDSTGIRKILVEVLRSDKTPVSGAKIWVRNTFAAYTSFVTDDKGIAKVEIGEATIDLTMIVDAEDFVPLRAMWGESELGLLPEKLIIEVWSGQPIGGRVVDQESQPIANAAVILSLSSPMVSERFRQNVQGVSVLTDVDGYWMYNRAPREIVSGSIVATHPMFVQADAKAFKTLQDGTFQIKMQPGGKVFGTVTDQDGNPIKNALLTVGSYGSPGGSFNRVRTDEQGHYELSNLTERDLQITIMAQGFAPDTKKLDPTSESQEVAFNLEKAGRIIFQIVEEDGQPVPQALISPFKWRDRFTLFQYFYDQIPYLTDANGILVWENAPRDSVSYDISANKLKGLQTEAIIADGTEHKFVLKKRPSITGKVVDDESGAPIPKFDVLYKFTGDPRYLRTFDVNGQFTFYISSDVSLGARAEGYFASDLQPLTIKDEKKQLEFRLKKCAPIEGTVVDATGHAGPEAQVFLLVDNEFVTFTNGAASYPKGLAFYKTRMDGHFNFPGRDDRYRLLVVAEDGYALMTDEKFAAAKNKVTLTKWAKLEGTLKTGDVETAGEMVSLSTFPSQRMPGIFRFEAQTDATGKFSIDKIPANLNWTLGRKILLSEQLDASSFGDSHARKIKLKAGETTQVVLGGYHGTVTGKFVLPDGHQGKLTDWNDSLRALTRVGGPDAKDLINPDDEGVYYFSIKQDGSFTVSDLPPGSYELTLLLYERTSGQTFGPRIGSAETRFTIPVNRDKQSIDLGNIQVD